MARLMVIDNIQQRHAFWEASLGGEGYQIDTVTDFMRAKSTLADRYYDVVITEWNQKGLNGTQLLKTIRSIWSEAEIIAISGSYSERDAEEACCNGVRDCLTLPISSVCIRRAVVNAIRIRERVSKNVQIEKEKINFLLETAPNAILIVDEDGTIQRTNERLSWLFGFSEQELLKRPIETLLVNSTYVISGIFKDKSQVRRGHILDAQRKDGSIFPVEVSFSRVTYNGNNLLVCHLCDVSERMAAETALRRSEVNFQALIEKTPDGIAVQSKGQLVYVNPALLRILGYESRDELLGMATVDLVHTDDRVNFIERLAYMAGLDGGKTTPWEGLFLRKNGETVMVEVVVIRVLFDGLPAIVIVVRDITERIELHAQLLSSDRIITVGTIAAGVAHEINNPLAYVLANLSFLKEEYHALGQAIPDCRQKEFSKALSEAIIGVDRVSQIVRDLKMFSRADDDNLELVDVHEVLDSAISIAANEIKHRSILIRNYLTVSPIKANASRLGQVFINLLINAAQSLPDGRAKDNQITVSTEMDSEQNVVVKISDTGTGVPNEIRDRIFEPFFTTKPIGEGTGLGLYICYSIVQRFNGEIILDTDVEGGSTFNVVLPGAEKQAVKRHFTSKTPRAKAASNAKVLLIDDEPFILRSLKRALLGYQIELASSGREALELLRSGRHFDVIFCDLMMPDITGMDVYEQIAVERPELVRRIVFMTGGAFSARAHEFFEKVNNPKIDKPFDIADVRQQVDTLLIQA